MKNSTTRFGCNYYRILFLAVLSSGLIFTLQASAIEGPKPSQPLEVRLSVPYVASKLTANIKRVKIACELVVQFRTYLLPTFGESSFKGVSRDFSVNAEGKASGVAAVLVSVPARHPDNTSLGWPDPKEYTCNITGITDFGTNCDPMQDYSGLNLGAVGLTGGNTSGQCQSDNSASRLSTTNNIR